ncbi:hypothetical protein BJY01DRAFT_218508 [Aspergillus pseudoustus]|uniref:Uncharacterized protein n=1 Tax=Aspergillus pseudoustus TaxID=1810923 RepID=A0ABR4JN32_9EURO
MDPKYNCMNEAVQQVTMPPDERWEAVLAPDAWKYALWAWRKRINDSDRILTFSQHVSQTLDYSQNMNCGDLNDQNGCYGDAKCDEQDPGPAAYFIILSFQAISKTLRNIYSALGDARDRVENQIGTFASKFAPAKEDDGLSTIIILDILSLGYAGAMAPIWNKWVSQTQWGSKNGNGPTAQAFTDGMTLQGITLAKDILAQNVWEAEKVLETQVDNVVFSWQNATSEYAQSLFDGTQIGISMLGILLSGGKMIDPRLSLPGPIDLDLQIRRTLWALLIPAAWRISGRDLNPFIVDTGLSCGDAPKDDDLQLRLQKDTLNDKIICDKKADRAYYLVSATDPEDKCRHGSNTGGYGCDKFEDLPGADELVGTTPEDEEDSQSLHWQMVDVEDLVFGSLATYKANGNKNVEEPKRFNDWESSSDWGEMLESLVDSDIRAPWVFTIPVCGVNEALWNYFHSTSTDREDRDPTFPCGENEWTEY